MPLLTEIEKRAAVGDQLKARSGVNHPVLYEPKAMAVRRPERGSHEPGANAESRGRKIIVRSSAERQ